jgi:hypothetical protein
MKLGSIAVLVVAAALAASLSAGAATASGSPAGALAGGPSGQEATAHAALPGAGSAAVPAALAAARFRRQQAASQARRPAAVTGLVRAFTGQPLAGVCVTALGTSGPAATQTSAGGQFFLAGLRAGRYTLEFRDCARPGRYLPQWSGAAVAPALARPLLISSGKVTRIATVTLLPASQAALLARPSAAQVGRAAGAPRTASAAPGGVSGRVTSTSGHPVTHTCVEIHFPGGYEGVPVSRRGTYTTGRSLPAGHYTVEFAAVDCSSDPGDWAPQWYQGKIRAAAANRVTVPAGKMTRHIDGTLHHGGIISGIVTGQAGRRVTGVCVWLFTRRGGFLAVHLSTRSGYSFRGLPAARYRLLFEPGCGVTATRYLSQWWRDQASFARSGSIPVRLGETIAGVDARLRVGGAITGTVRGASGRPLRGICVSAWPVHDASAPGYLAGTRKNGSYVLEGMAAATYSLEFSPGCFDNSNYLDASYPHPIHVTDGRTVRGINGVLQPGGVITGTVTNLAGRPLAHIAVFANDAAGDGNGACTTATGTFALTQLPPGGYAVSFSNQCGGRGNWAPQSFPGQADPGDAAPVKVGRGQRVTGIDARMRPGSVIAGTVTSRAGQDAGKICVNAQPPDDAYLLADFGLTFGAQTQTSSNGTYRIPDLAAGRYAVQFSECGAPDYADRWFGGSPATPIGDLVDVSAGATVGGVSAVVSPGGGITGNVRSAAGKPLQSSCVQITSLRAGAAAVGATFFGSSYRAAGLAPGRYRVEFYTCMTGANYATQWFDRKSTPGTATAVRVTAGHATSSVDAAQPAGGSISGRLTVRATGTPLTNFCVEASSVSGFYSGFAVTSKTGDYDVRGLNTGTYRLLFTNCLGSRASFASRQLTRTIRVTAPRTVRGINASLAALPAGGSISGQVRAGSPTATGQGDVCVEADPVSAAGQPGSTTTGYQGRYVLPGLRPGIYRVYFGTRTSCDDGQDALVPQWYGGAATRARAATVTVMSGAVTPGIDATLREDGGISGTVTAAGSPLSGVCVRAVPRAAGRSAIFTATAGGRYSLAGLIPGAYTVRFSSGCGAAGYATQWWDRKGSAATATVINVTAGAVRTGIDAALTH